MTTSTWATTIAPVPLSPEQWRVIDGAYAEPHRAYHDGRHLREVLEQWLDVDRRLGWDDRVSTFLALCYHDAVYEPGRSDNEARSAVLAREQLRGMRQIDTARIEHLIRLTARHGRLTPPEVDRDAALMLDGDLAIIAAATPRFTEYDQAIRVEYAQVAEAVYRAGRRRFLEQLLARDRIFLSEDFHARLDAAARVNLRTALIGG